MLKKKNKKKLPSFNKPFLGGTPCQTYYRCWEYSNGEVEVPVLHKQITENRVSGEGKQNET